MPERAANKGGRGKCATCAHQGVDQINADLVANIPMQKISRDYGIAPSSLRAHKANHLGAGLAALTKARETAKAADRQAAAGETGAALDQIRNLKPLLFEALKWAQERYNGYLVVQVSKEIRETLQLEAKITGELDERPTTTINVLTTEAWLQLRGRLMSALAPHPEARLAVAAELLALEAHPIDS